MKVLRTIGNRGGWIGSFVLAGALLLSSCSSSSVVSDVPSPSGPASSSPAPADEHLEAASRFGVLQSHYNVVYNQPLTEASTWDEFHDQLAQTADACQTWLAGLKAGPWPSDAQDEVEAFSGFVDRLCGYWQSLAEFPTADKYNEGRSSLSNPSRTDEYRAAEIAASDAVGGLAS